MKRNKSFIESLDNFTDPEILFYDNKKEKYREDYTELIRALTVYLFASLSERYNYIPKNERYHLLLPVLGFISGEWSTYIVNVFFHINETSPIDNVSEEEKINLIKDIIFNAHPFFTYMENSRGLYYDRSIRQLITIILDNDQTLNKFINQLLNKKIEYQSKTKFSQKKEFFNFKKITIKFLRNIKDNYRINGYSFWQVLEILFLTFNNNVSQIYEASRNHTNKFIQNSLEIDNKIISKYFSLQQQELLSNMVAFYLPVSINPENLKGWMTKKKNFLNHPIKFCGPYVREIKTIKSMFLQRLNKKLIIGSQHGSNYGYSFNNIKHAFAEFLLDGYISAGFTSEQTSKWTKPYLGFFPISPLFAKLTINETKEKKIGNELTCLYVESLFDLRKGLSIDRASYSPTLIKINSFNLIKSFLNQIKEKDFERLFIKPWLFEEKISPLKDSQLMSLTNVEIVKYKLSNFMKKFDGLIILDDLSTPMLEAIVLNKPILIIISRLDRHTILADKFFAKMTKHKYIVNSIEDAKESIKRFQEDSKSYRKDQMEICKEFRKIYCNPEYFSTRSSALQINKILKLKRYTTFKVN